MGNSQQYLTVREVADVLRVKERKVYALAAEGTIPCSRAIRAERGMTSPHRITLTAFAGNMPVTPAR